MNGKELILSVDPGQTTGVAVLRREMNHVCLDWSDEVSEDDFADVIRKVLSGWRERKDLADIRMTVVCESFLITMETAKKSQAPFSLEMIGVLKQCCRDEGYPLNMIYWQTPADAKSVVTNPKLKRLDLWHVGGDGHAMDAIRHGVLCLIERGWTDTRLLK